MSTILSPRVAAASLLVVGLSLSACAVPDLGPKPQMRAPSTLDSAQSLSSQQANAAWPQQQWWTAYGDPQLDALVTEALAGSPDVAVAQARIMQARGATEVAGAATLPSVNGQGSAGMAKQSYNNGIPAEFVPHGWKSTGSLALSGDFDLDLWGKNRKQLAAATSEQMATEADARQAELMISSNVVSSYFDLARLIARGEALKDAVKARESLVDLSGQRMRQGLDDESPLRQAEALAASARAALSANDEQILLRRHALAVLLGAGPDRGLSITPTSIAAIPVAAIPGDAGIGLVGRRPDIVAARLRAEAADKRIGAAKAAFMPDISLSGLIGLQSLGLSNLFKGSSTYGNGTGAISLPIFEGGRLKGGYTQARGSYDEAVANYNSTVAGALRDVADALASRDAALVQEQASAEAGAKSARAQDLALQRYHGGIGNYLDALTAQTTALDARQQAVDAHFRTLAEDVALKRALGGGYEDNSSKKAADND
ncbi:NodT family efflux transporter outer membrane factor (OMF) lipoprotein [Novosphingobium sp. PhB165]|uniref:efflux transporter outer membrane subunit n=1 Tax=Novosphingobium sp. PhB165 TaxID=2485105 RepID=UPI0010520E06|nr:efflux transporter outer membrane subunit [Novosphingobium sp. PhB165]TCM19577.1 NodT family efflux transporter outer membrane factor (OMF) lipoprotein [Novosphingobium sp. PhB165]